MKRFLIIQTAFLGDVILATPVISELKRLYPNAVIDVLVRKGNELILTNNPHLRRVFTFNKKEGKFLSMLMLIQQFRKEHYDEIINLHRFASTGFISIMSGAKKTIGFDKNPFSPFYSKRIKHEIGTDKHEVVRNLQTIHHHGAERLKRPEIFPSNKDYEEVLKYQQPVYYCLAPASVWFTKQLPAHKWVELGKKLAEKGTIYLVGGTADVELCELIKEQIPVQHVENMAGKLTFLQSAALFQKATMNYVNDSGPLHLCSAVNAPVTAFFCSTVPAFGFGPLSDNSTLIETKEKLACKPCGLHGFKACPKGHFKCGEGIVIA